MHFREPTDQVMKDAANYLKGFLPLPTKRAIRKSIRLSKGYLGVMPDFVIIGAQRSGTTSLYNYLIEHPNIVSAYKKELHFFDIGFSRGIRWYRSRFPSFLHKCFAQKVRQERLVTGESSPYYLFHPHAPGRMSEVLPEVKLIVLLRNPADRAYSQYQYNVRKGYEELPFEDAIEKEDGRLDGERERIIRNPNYHSFSHQHHSYLSRGIYVDQLKRWMSYFPREQFLILKSEGFYADPGKIFNQVLAFLDLPAFDLRTYEKCNPVSYRKMQADTRKRLVDFFRPHNQRLYEYLGMNFGWDK